MGYSKIEIENCTSRSDADIYIEVQNIPTKPQTPGYTAPYATWGVSTANGSFYDSTIRGTVITLNEYAITTERQLRRTMRHELGHALMLAHPFYEVDNDEEFNNVNMEWVAYSIMNQGGDVSHIYPKVSYYIEYYDVRTLRNKWT